MTRAYAIGLSYEHHIAGLVYNDCTTHKKKTEKICEYHIASVVSKDNRALKTFNTTHKLKKTELHAQLSKMTCFVSQSALID